MKDSLYIAWRYVAYHRVKTAILITAITFMLFLPLALRTLVAACERQLMARAASTPLIVGAKGSSLDLAIDTLYFEPKPVDPITMAEMQRVERSGMARAVPIFTRFQARGHVIAGTTLDYFEFRNLVIDNGRQITRLGDCVLGATAAERLDLGPGDHLLSSPEDLFNLAGTFPLKMHVAGVLARSHTPDDRADFVDIKTAWIIAGLGHGHQDLQTVDDPDVLLRRDGRDYTANAKLLHYNEITEENIDSFHFHGDVSEFPITAVLAIPRDKKSEDLLRGRYQSIGEPCQILRPAHVIRDLTATVFKVEGMLNSAFVLTGGAATMLIGLVVMLSLRLRHREVQTMFKLGCSRWKTAELLISELLIIATASLLLTGLAVTLTTMYVDQILRRMIL